MSSLRFLVLVSFVLLTSAKDTSNETHSEGEDIECLEQFCPFGADAHTSEEYRARLCEPACEEELQTALRVAHFNYGHVQSAFGGAVLIMVVIFAKLCKY